MLQYRLEATQDSAYAIIWLKTGCYKPAEPSGLEYSLLAVVLSSKTFARFLRHVTLCLVSARCSAGL